MSTLLKPLMKIENLDQILFGKTSIQENKNSYVKKVEKLDELKFLPSGKILFPSLHDTPPLIYASKAPTFQIETSHIDSNIYFRRAGIIPYVQIDDKTLFFFNVFQGSDREKKINEELSDFGGNIGKEENFVEGAIAECLEESLGIFNFTGKVNEVASISTALFTLDRSYIIMLVPIVLNTSAKQIREFFQSRRQEIEDIAPQQQRKFISNIGNFEIPDLDMSDRKLIKNWYTKKASARKSNFNYTESKDLIYVNSTTLGKLLQDEQTKFPPLYFAIKDRLNQSDFIAKLI